TSGGSQPFNLLNYSIVFFAVGLENQILSVISDNWPVGRNYHYVQFINLPKFTCFRLGCTGHTRKLVIHTEVVLKRNCRKGLRGRFNLYVLLSLDCLVKTIGIPTAIHDTACLLVNNLNFTVDNYIFIVFFKKSVSLKQLIHCVNALGLYGKVAEEFLSCCKLIIFRKIFRFKFSNLCGDVLKYEEIFIVVTLGHVFHTFVGKVYLVVLFVNNEVQVLIHDWHIAVVILHILSFHFLEKSSVSTFGKKLNQLTVLWKSTVRLQKLKSTFFCISGRDQFLGFVEDLRNSLLLYGYDSIYRRFQHVKFLTVALRNRSRNDKRSSGIINKNRIHLIHNRKVKFTLNKFVW